MVKATIHNSFHGTQATVIVPGSVYVEGEQAVYQYLERMANRINATNSDKSRFRRVRKALCGSADCTCGVVR